MNKIAHHRPFERVLLVALTALRLFGAAPALADDLPETVRPPQAPVAADSAALRVPVGSAGESWYQRDMRRADSLLAVRGGVRADSARLLLTWNAPAGWPRASDSRRHTCAARDSADTLYLSFLPGRASSGFNGFTASVRFHAQTGDTLGPWWHFERGGAHAGGMSCQFDPTAEIPGNRPWSHTGIGHVAYQRTPASAQLRLVYAVPTAQAEPLEPTTAYVLGRVILKRLPALRGCEQPVCVEWEEATLAFALKDEPRVQQGDRFVSWNSPDGVACAPLRSGRRPDAWRPRPQ